MATEPRAMASTSLVFLAQRPVAPFRMAPNRGMKGMSQSTELWIGVLRAVLMVACMIIRSPEIWYLRVRQPLRRLIWSTWMVSFFR